VVRAHKQTRKHIHGFYELHFEKREAAICGHGHRPHTDGKKARSAYCKNLTDKARATQGHRGGFGAGAGWVKTFERGNARSSVALSEPSFDGGAVFQVGVKSGRVGFRLDENPRPRTGGPICRARIIGSNAWRRPKYRGSEGATGNDFRASGAASAAALARISESAPAALSLRRVSAFAVFGFR